MKAAADAAGTPQPDHRCRWHRRRQRRGRARAERRHGRVAGGRRRSPRSMCAAARRVPARPTCCSPRTWWTRCTASALSGGSAFGLDAASGVGRLAAPPRPRALCRAGRRARADRAGGNPVRPGERRRQDLAGRSALSRAGQRGLRRGRRGLHPGQRRGRTRRRCRAGQGRPGQRLGGRRRRAGGRRRRRGERYRLADHARAGKRCGPGPGSRLARWAVSRCRPAAST